MEILKKANLDWNVIVEKVQTISGLDCDRIAIVREDTQKVLGVFGDGYYPVQNAEMVRILTEVSSTENLDFHRGGYFGEGEKVFIQLKSDDLILGHDKVKGYLTAINSFDGSTQFGFGNSNITISCQNSFHYAYRNLGKNNGHKVKHTKNAEVKIEEILASVKQATKAEKAIFQKIKKMAETPATPKHFEWALGALLDLKGQERLGDLSTLSTQKKNKLEEMEASFKHQIHDKGNTLWGVFSGVTHYTTHKLKGDADQNKMFGIYGERESKIFTNFAEMVS